jgi:hypothetical protein
MMGELAMGRPKAAVRGQSGGSGFLALPWPPRTDHPLDPIYSVLRLRPPRRGRGELWGGVAW